MYKIGGKIRVACGGLIYQKSLRIFKSSAQSVQTGTIVNLLANDVKKFDEAILLAIGLWCAPLEIVSFFIITYLEVGVSALAGIGFLMCFIPLQCKFKRVAKSNDFF